MASIEEKKRELAKLLKSKELAEIVFQAAAQKEALADAAGIRYKEADQPASFSAAPGYLASPQTGIGAVMGNG